MSVCAPGVKDKHSSCYSKENLVLMIKEYNKKHPKNKITIGKKTKPQLLKELRNKLSNKCNTEWCWIDQDFLNKNKAQKIAKETFRPKMPEHWKKNKYAWLATDDIEVVMDQYEDLYPDFIFLGAVPVDCPKLSFCQLYKLDVQKLYKNGIRKIGIVFNLDYHYQSGSHWVAVFVDLDKHKDITYYDSYGEKPPALIDNFMNDIYHKASNIRGLNNKLKIDYNKKRHQYGFSECGIYSQNYIPI